MKCLEFIARENCGNDTSNYLRNAKHAAECRFPRAAAGEVVQLFPANKQSEVTNSLRVCFLLLTYPQKAKGKPYIRTGIMKLNTAPLQVRTIK